MIFIDKIEPDHEEKFITRPLFFSLSGIILNRVKWTFPESFPYLIEGERKMT